MNIHPNPADVLEFFESTLADQIHLCAIDPEQSKPTTGRDFSADAEAATEWACKRNSEGLNVYYTVNRVRSGVHKKPNKNEIVGVRFAHLDIDPPKGLTAFTEDEKRAVETDLMASDPCTIIWSGNGAQALWRLDDGVSAEQVEEVNKGLIEAFGGDKSTYNVDRLLRVPGLVNYPDAKKREKGRVPTLASIRYTDTGATINVAQLIAAYPPHPTASTPPTPEDQPREAQVRAAIDWQRLTADGLRLPEDSLLRRLIDEPKGEDRSRDSLAMACEGLRHGLTKAEVTGILLNPTNAVSAHCIGQQDPDRAAWRAICRALREDDVMHHFRAHERERERRLASGEMEAAEAAQSAQTKIWTLETMLKDCIFIEDGSQVADTTRLGYVRSLPDFRNATAASVVAKVVRGRGGSVRKGKPNLVADLWLAHPERTTVSTRTFKAGDGPIVAAPDGQKALNTWRGFRIDAAPDDWAERSEIFVGHVHMLFGDDTERFLDWTAHIAQKPGELPSTAWLHISRKTGTGRNLIAKILGRVFVGYAALAFPLAATFRDGFNAGLAAKVLAVVDEIDEGHSNRKHQIAQDLKQLVTAERRTINQKFERKYEESNACRWLIFSNSPAALPLEDEDRRFNVVNFDGEPKDTSYYNRLYQLAEDPAFIASVMHSLLQRDISGFNKGARAMMTPAKADLLNRTRSEDDQTLREIANRWPADIITSAELHEQLGDGRITGAALRHALDRAGIIRVHKWKENSAGFGRQKVTAYAVRNHDSWKAAGTALLRKEIGRLSKTQKEAALYDAADMI